MINLLTALYNEEREIDDLINWVGPYVDRMYFVDDGSTDKTIEKILDSGFLNKINVTRLNHTALCEVARIEGLKFIPDDEWVLMLDADERIPIEQLEAIRDWVGREPDITHVWFHQKEYIDGVNTKSFSKVKLYKKSAAHLSPIIHSDPQFDGKSVNNGWTVIHRKSSGKQLKREKEYLSTYNKLLDEGVIDEGKRKWFLSMHYYVRDEPHG